MGTDESPGGDRILAVVVEILENEGYDAVQLREVARRARTSLATIYKRYATRDELIVAAIEIWLAKYRYSSVSAQPRQPGASLYSALMGLLRTIFEPWEQHPGMLTAYFRVRSAPGGLKLFHRGLDIVGPAGLELFAGVDEQFIADFDVIVSNVVYGLLGRFAAGEIAITEILSALDRTVYWLTLGYESAERPASESDVP